MSKNRSMKVALASALAASAVVPAVAVQANEATKVADGTYQIAFTSSDPDLSLILSSPTTITVKDGKFYADFYVGEAMRYVHSATVDGVDVINGKNLSFSFTDLAAPLNASVEVTMPYGEKKGQKQTRNFTITLDPASLKPVSTGGGTVTPPAVEQPVEQAPATKQKANVYAYKDGTNELSMMHKTYLETEATYTEVNGSYAVDFVFPQGQYVNELFFEGQTVAETSAEKVGNNTVRIYTVNVNSLTEIYDMVIDLKVHVGPVNYEEKHKVQIQLGGKKNPFADITKLSNYGKIVSLYSAGIYKEQAKFNPYGKVNRSQFALMLQRALSYNVPAGASEFADVNSIKDTETVNAIKALAAKEVIKGSQGKFNPYGEIRRDQAAQMIYRVLTAAGYKSTGLASPFADTAALSLEAKSAIAELNALGIMTGSQGKFNPKNTLTRDQMSKVLANTLQVIDTLK